ncbi:hypothetical protein E2C01_059463 [Portunus trituberculatus]|uniref:Uncharacterized protein n=1 Tax=Portunus trituberculatus TaxID=210409 RepID=A0A5B7GZ84_PORTR|nr:hypothetical protein [Portunus trituberculatus]
MKNKESSIPAEEIHKPFYLNPFNTGTHFYLEICVRLDHFIYTRKYLWRSED